jgi:hypothetical protein
LEKDSTTGLCFGPSFFQTLNLLLCAEKTCILSEKPAGFSRFNFHNQMTYILLSLQEAVSGKIAQEKQWPEKTWSKKDISEYFIPYL